MLATANCTTDGSRAFLAARLVRRGDANVDVVSGHPTADQVHEGQLGGDDKPA